MLLTPDPTSQASRLARHDSVFVLLLMLTLVLATWTFFSSFALAALLAGLLLSIPLHRHADDAGIESGDYRQVGINVSRIRVGGDAGGLITVVGSLAVLALGLPMLRWFLVASILVASVVAIGRIAWARRAV